MIALSACPPVLGSIDEEPPGEVIDIAAVAGDRRIKLSWLNPIDSDFERCRLTYGPETGEQTEFTGLLDSTGTLFSGLENGTVYTFTMKTVDFKGNISEGMSVDGIPFAGGESPVPVTGIVIDTGELNLQTGGTAQLGAAIQPADATDFRFEWRSSDETVATVGSDGIVLAVGEGSALVLAVTNEGSFSDYCALTVTDIPVYSVTGVSINPDNLEMIVGEDYQLSVGILPDNATNQIVYWTSDDSAIAGVSGGGLVSGVSAGLTTIRVTTDDGGFEASAAVTVTEALSVAAPTGLTAIMTNHTAGTSGSQVDLTWTDNSDNETGFEIQRRSTPEGGTAGLWSEVDGGTASAGTGTVTETDTPVDLGDMVEYRVRAVSGSTPSDWSNTAVVADQYEDADDADTTVSDYYGWGNTWEIRSSSPVNDNDWIALQEWMGFGQRSFAIYLDDYSGGEGPVLELRGSGGLIEFMSNGYFSEETTGGESTNLIYSEYVNSRDTPVEDASMVVFGDSQPYLFRFANDMYGAYRFRLVYCGDKYEALEYGNDSSTDYYWSGAELYMHDSLTLDGFTLHDATDEDWTAFYLNTYGSSEVTVEISCPEGIPGGNGWIAVEGSSYGELVPQEVSDYVSFTFPADSFDTIFVGVGGNWSANVDSPGSDSDFSLEIYVHEVW